MHFDIVLAGVCHVMEEALKQSCVAFANQTRTLRVQSKKELLRNIVQRHTQLVVLPIYIKRKIQ